MGRSPTKSGPRSHLQLCGSFCTAAKYSSVPNRHQAILSQYLWQRTAIIPHHTSNSTGSMGGGAVALPQARQGLFQQPRGICQGF